MKRRWILLWSIVCIAVATAQSQSVRSLVNEGNDLYEDQKYGEAELRYRKALNEDAGSVAGRFNLGNSLYKQQKYEESVREFESAAMGTDVKQTRARAEYNKGNSFLEAGRLDEAINAYTESLKLDPSDQDAKYNLSYAIRKRTEQQQQQKQEGEQKKNDQKQQEEQNQQNQQKDKQGNGQQQDEKKDRQNEGKENNQQQSPQDQQQNKQQKGDEQVSRERMSKADAERILEVLKNNEKEVQKKLRAKAKSSARVEKDW